MSFYYVWDASRPLPKPEDFILTTTSNMEDFKIKKGDKFFCICTVLDITKRASFIEGEVYVSANDDFISNRFGEECYMAYLGQECNWTHHFQRHEEKGEKYCGCKPDRDYFQTVQEEYGKRQFESGAVRDTNKNKPFIHCLLGYTRQRFGYHMAKNASKYGENNFLKGIPTEAYLESMDRHLAAYMEGDRSEDHLSAILFGVNGIMLNEKKEEGLPADFYFKN